MNAKDAISSAINLSQMIMSRYLGDLSDADLMQRPGQGCNHIAFQLGHLISSQAGILNGLVPNAAPELPAGFKEKHDKANCASDNPADFCSKATYLDLMQKLNEATLKALNSIDEKELDEPSPEFLRNFLPTKGQAWMLIGTHPIMHAGQFVPVRRALGKPVVI